ncbi:pimeloyl-ACP methyl ester carboxylesterase [Nocardia tenerifensis]|uniref:Pimeloyl-ACP methyl ester carboxylesterase n=1 Tax=Nocardia tenerifensis TaxID=228006 RepID=A0A318KL39_9NOCA|nr:alpha/beta hydrolase [Nocardia tenerifensis]PXX69147.1 pimeloyl-ACP methyl ester carboxylesterase [Nocardia tenerifensis]
MTAIPLQTTVTGSGPGLVLAHGAGGTIETNFGALIPALAATHTVVASDYPGSDIQLDLDGLADALVAAAVESGVERFTIVGYSLGSAVAVRAAVRHPDRVGGLVLAAGFAKADNRARLAVQIWQDLLDRGDTATFSRFALGNAFSAGFLNSLPAEQVDEFVRVGATTIPGGTLQQASLVETLDTTGDLGRIAVPTLVVNAAADLLIDPANSRYLARSIPGAEYTEIAAGHVLMAEQPDQWRKTVEDFLARHRL